MFEWFEGEVQDLERRRASVPPHPVAFYGSSSIRLWETLADDFAPDLVANLGFGGSTLSACAYFFERLVPPLEPHSLIFYAGDNDIGDGQSPGAVLGAFDEMLWKVGRDLPGIPFGFLSIKPSVQRAHLMDRIRVVNDGARARLEGRPDCTYLDIFTPMLSDSGRPRPELFTEDGLHMNRDGYRIWWQVISAHRHQLGL